MASPTGFEAEKPSEPSSQPVGQTHNDNEYPHKDAKGKQRRRGVGFGPLKPRHLTANRWARVARLKLISILTILGKEWDETVLE